jgi:hypothetical protein
MLHQHNFRCPFLAAIHDMGRKQQPKHEQYCEEDWNEESQMPAEAYWVSKVRCSLAGQPTAMHRMAAQSQHRSWSSSSGTGTGYQ